MDDCSLAQSNEFGKKNAGINGQNRDGPLGGILNLVELNNNSRTAYASQDREKEICV